MGLLSFTDVCNWILRRKYRALLLYSKTRGRSPQRLLPLLVSAPPTLEVNSTSPLFIFNVCVRALDAHFIILESLWTKIFEMWAACEETIYSLYNKVLKARGQHSSVSFTYSQNLQPREKQGLSYICYTLLIQRRAKMTQTKHTGRDWLLNTGQRDFEHTNSKITLHNYLTIKQSDDNGDADDN